MSIYDKVLSKSQILTIKQEPPVCGIYFLISGEEIVYVGRSEKIYNRVGTHKKTMDFDSFSFIEMSYGESVELEPVYIEKFMPKYNKGYKELVQLMSSLDLLNGTNFSDIQITKTKLITGIERDKNLSH